MSIGWALCLALIGTPEILLFTAPVFLLAAPLALGRYSGEKLIAAASRRIRFRPAKTETATVGLEPARVPFLTSPLIASNLAGRAPPATLA